MNEELKIIGLYWSIGMFFLYTIANFGSEFIEFIKILKR